MGCGSSSNTNKSAITAGNAQLVNNALAPSSANKLRKGVLPSVVEVQYFASAGRADPIIQMFEYHG